MGTGCLGRSKSCRVRGLFRSIWKRHDQQLRGAREGPKQQRIRRWGQRNLDPSGEAAGTYKNAQQLHTICTCELQELFVSGQEPIGLLGPAANQTEEIEVESADNRTAPVDGTCIEVTIDTTHSEGRHDSQHVHRSSRNLSSRAGAGGAGTGASKRFGTDASDAA